MRRSGAALAAALALLGAACAAHPLGDDFDGLAPPAREARAVEALADLLGRAVTATGEAVEDRRVLACDRAGAEYEAAGARSRLRWLDIDDVVQTEHPDLPYDPVELLLYVRDGSPSASTIADLTVPTLAKVGVTRPYLRLRMRPKGARARLLAALAQVRGRPPGGATAPVDSATAAAPASPAPASPAPAAPAAPAATRAARLAEVEAELRRLRAWRDEGLITEEQLERRRQALLDGLDGP